MTQPTATSVVSKRQVDSPLDGDHAVVDTITSAGGYSEENYRKLKRKLKEILLVNN
jgi:hypothetical protein